MTRAILHSDLNAFYASVEMMLNPSLRGKAVAVCGSTEERHGIVLAKSELAKKAGIKTGMVNWEARQKCPNLIMVPPQYEQYLKVSQLVRAIYGRYTDQVEPFGMDECWLDVTGSAVMGTCEEIAEEIRQSVKEELGLTVSIGVSFNKIFAKLGSDMKKKKSPGTSSSPGAGSISCASWATSATQGTACCRSHSSRTQAGRCAIRVRWTSTMSGSITRPSSAARTGRRRSVCGRCGQRTAIPLQAC